MTGNKYLHFSSEDFASDAYFQNWVLQDDHMTNLFWEKWKADHPEKLAEIELAKELINQFKFKEYQAATDDFNEVWKNLMAEQRGELKPIRTHRRKWYWGGSIAAACISLLVISIFFWKDLNKEDRIYFSTGFNESLSIVLPDSSAVILNSNSELSYPINWDNLRQVFLTGEAHFSIVHTIDDKKFIVHADNMGIEVLGTEFVVNLRRGKAQVVLQSGKVRLNLPNDAIDADTPVIMQPGELVAYSQKHKGLMKKEVDPEIYSAWVRNEIIFDNTSLLEVGHYIEDNYGYKVSIEDEELLEKLFTAKINNKSDLNLLITILQETFNINIYKNQTEIIMEKP